MFLSIETFYSVTSSFLGSGSGAVAGGVGDGDGEGDGVGAKLEGLSRLGADMVIVCFCLIFGSFGLRNMENATVATMPKVKQSRFAFGFIQVIQNGLA